MIWLIQLTTNLIIMKTLKELKNVKVLSKNEQKAITGGYNCVFPTMWCPPGTYCQFPEDPYEGGRCLRIK